MNTTTEQHFESGRMLATPGAIEAIDPQDMAGAVRRHLARDWGDCGPEDWAENDLALREGFRLFSVYHDRHGVKFWIITEADRSATTILLPEEY
jgi:hypothetical protein